MRVPEFSKLRTCVTSIQSLNRQALLERSFCARITPFDRPRHSPEVVVHLALVSVGAIGTGNEIVVQDGADYRMRCGAKIIACRARSRN